MFQSTPGIGAAAGVGGAGGAGGPQAREVTYRVRVVADVSQYNATVAAMGQSGLQNAQARHLGRTPTPTAAWPPVYYQHPAYYQHPGYYPPAAGGPTGGGGGGGGPTGGGGDALANLALLWARVGTAVSFVVTALEKFQRVLDAVSVSGRETVNANAKMQAWFDAVPVVGQPLGQAMSFGASLQERWGYNGGFGYTARAAANGNLQRGQANLVAGGVPTWLAGVAGEFIAGEREYNAARDRTFLTPYDMARDAAAAQARRRRDELDAGEEAMGFGSHARMLDARGQARLMFARGAPGSRPFDNGSGRVRFDSDNGYDAVIRGAERGRVSAAAARGQAWLEREAARVASAEAGNEVDRAPFRAAQRRVDELQRRAKDDPTIQGQLSEAIAAAEKESARLAEQLARHQAAINKEKERTVALAQADYELAQKTLGVQQARLSVLDDKMRKNDAGATSFAFAGPAERASLLDAARRLSETDFDQLSPRQRDLLGSSGITAEWLQKKGRDWANADNFTRGQLDELFKLTGQQTRSELMEERKKIMAEIEVQVVVNQQKLADALRDAFKKLDPELRKLLEESFQLNVAKTRREEAAGRAQNR